MNNCWPLPEYGTQRRPPTNHVAELINAEATSPTVAQITGAFFHSINRDVNERYEVIITSSGDIHVYDEDGASQVVYQTEYSTYLIQSNPYQNFKAVTIADYTFIANKNVAVTSDGTSTSAKVYEALVFIKNTDFNTEFTIIVDGTPVSSTTGTAEDPSERAGLDTVALATALIVQLNADGPSGFTYTQYGPVIHVAKTDGTDFSIDTRDGLANTALLVIKDKFEDPDLLPRIANDGFVVEITGDRGTEWDNYFMKFESRGSSALEPGDASSVYDGVWIETLAPGEEKALDRRTMPHVLVREGFIQQNLRSKRLPATSYAGQGGTAINDGWTSIADKAAPENGGLALVLQASNMYPGGVWNNDASQAMATSGGGYSNLEDQDDDPHTITVTYDIDMSCVSVNYVLAVLEYTTDAGVTWQSASLNTHWAQDGNVSCAQMTHDVALDSSADLRIHFKTQGIPAGPWQLDGPARITLHGEDHAATAGVEYTLSADYLLKFTQPDTSGQLWPLGTSVLMEITPVGQAQESTILITTSDEVSSDISVLAQVLLNAFTNITAVDQGDGTVLIQDSGGTPAIDTFSHGLTSGAYFITDSLFSSLDLSTHTVKNLTDGSTAEILANTSATLRCDGLAGGTDNSFQPNDIITIEGRAGTAFFVFRPAQWEERAVGRLQDGDKVNMDGTIKRGTNPWPSFKDKKINDIFYYKGRLGVVSEEACIMTQAQDLFNWFRKSVQSYVDSDPIDIEITTPDVAVFQHVTHWNKKLWVWSEQAQFTLESSDQGLLGPKTAYLKPQTRYECSWRVRPWVAGERQYFCNYRTGHTHVMEMVQDQYTESYKAESVSKHVPGYIEGNPIQIVGSQQYGFLAVFYDTAKTEIYTYNYHFQNGEKVQGAWHKWVFQNTVLGMYMIDQKMGVMTKATDGIFIETMDIDPAESDNGSSDRLTYVDRRMLSSALTVNYNNTVSSETAWILPFDVSTLGTEGTVVAVARGTGEILGSARPAGSSVVASSGNVDATGTDAYVGILYDSCVVLLDQHFRDPRSGRLRDDGRFTVRRMGINYEETLDLDVDINPLNSCNLALPLVGSTIPVTDGEESFSVGQRSSEVTITYQTTGHQPFTLKSGWWEGNFYARGRRT
jgi:hypothetical protein